MSYRFLDSVEPNGLSTWTMMLCTAKVSVSSTALLGKPELPRMLTCHNQCSLYSLEFLPLLIMSPQISSMMQADQDQLEMTEPARARSPAYVSCSV